MSEARQVVAGRHDAPAQSKVMACVAMFYFTN